jgi:hypothetical protein
MMASPEGTYVISWAQSEVDGIAAAPVASLDEGAYWIWRGEPVRIDGASGFRNDLRFGHQDSYRKRAAASARRIVSRALVMEGVRTPYSEFMADFDRTFRVTDGQSDWMVTLIEMAEIARPLLMFTGQLPPRDVPLRICSGVAAKALPSVIADAAEGVVCFTPGTVLETPEGLKPVETLVAGDLVVTKDGGAQPIVWAGNRNVSGARLYAMPDLRPVRIRAGALGDGRPSDDLIVSPDHKMVVRGEAAQALWGEAEVLAAARDLIDGTRIARDLAAKSVTYCHLMLEQHHILVANGVETESFHPAAASLETIEEDQRERLFDVLPGLEDDPTCYGPTSRRVLSQGEAALLSVA